MKKKQSKWIWKTVVIACVATSILGYMCVPPTRDMMNKIVTMFATGDFGVIREFMTSYGSYAATVSLGLMVLRSVTAPLPTPLIVFASADLFGWRQGTILSWSSAMTGAALCFCIARILKRGAAKKLISKAGLKQVGTFFDKYGKGIILIRRLPPSVSFDTMSYGAGLMSTPSLSFLVAAGIGQFSATVVYSHAGGMLAGGARFFVIDLLMLSVLPASIAMIRKIYIEEQNKTRRKKWKRKLLYQDS